jgi:hypothetical protein
VVRILSRIKAEGAYRRQMSIWEGQTKATELEDAARMKDRDARVARFAKKTAVLNTVLNVGGSLYDRFGQGGPASAFGGGSSNMPDTFTNANRFGAY